jgi:hypothetical protein
MLILVFHFHYTWKNCQGEGLTELLVKNISTKEMSEFGMEIFSVANTDDRQKMTVKYAIVANMAKFHDFAKNVLNVNMAL